MNKNTLFRFLPNIGMTILFVVIFIFILFRFNKTYNASIRESTKKTLEAELVLFSNNFEYLFHEKIQFLDTIIKSLEKSYNLSSSPTQDNIETIKKIFDKHAQHHFLNLRFYDANGQLQIYTDSTDVIDSEQRLHPDSIPRTLTIRKSESLNRVSTEIIKPLKKGNQIIGAVSIRFFDNKLFEKISLSNENPDFCFQISLHPGKVLYKSKTLLPADLKDSENFIVCRYLNVKNIDFKICLIKKFDDVLKPHSLHKRDLVAITIVFSLFFIIVQIVILFFVRRNEKSEIDKEYLQKLNEETQLKELQNHKYKLLYEQLVSTQKALHETNKIIEHGSYVLFLVKTDTALTIDFVSGNPKNLQDFKTESETIIGKSFFTLIHPDDIILLKSALFENIGDSDRERIIPPIRLKNKKEKYISGAVKERKAENGEPGNFELILSDVSQKVEDERLIKKLTEAVENSPITITITDIEGNIEYVNAHFEKLTGYSKSEAMSMTPKMLKSGKTPVEIYKNLWETILDGRIWEGEFINKKKDGTEFIELTKISSVKDHTGHITHFVAVKEDITRRKLYEKNLEQKEEEQRKILNTFNEGIYINSPDYTILYTNTAMDKLIGHPSTGEKCHKAIFNRDEKCPWCAYDKLRKEGKKIEYEIQRGEQYLNVNHFLLDNGNKLTAYYDITKIKNSEEAIRDSEEKFRLIFNNTDDAIFVSEHAEGQKPHYIEINDSACRMLGYEREELLEMQAEDIVESTSTEMQKAVGELYKSNKLFSNVNFISKSGQKIPVEVVSQLTEIQGKRTVLSSARDITRRIATENALRESERNFRLLFENSPIGTFIATPQGELLDANSALLRILGSPFKENTLKINVLKFKPLMDNGFAHDFLKCAQTGEIISIESDYTSKWGKKTYISSYIVPLKNEKGKTEKIYTVMQDITETKQYEADLKKAKIKAEESGKLKSEFLANMSHEIRTPMNAIIGFSNILSKKIKTSENLVFIEKIIKSADSLLNLINNILDLSKIEAGQLNIKIEAFDFKQLINEVLMYFPEKTANPELEVMVVFDKKFPPTIFSDSLRFRQILLNLIGNAYKFTEKGKIEIRTEIIAINKNEHKKIKTFDFALEVADTGIGIPEDLHDTIFESFRQIEGQNSRKYGGTGLGLSITHSLVNMLGGTISVASKPNEGSVFRIEFRNIEYSDNQTDSEKETSDNDEIVFMKSKVLFADDIEYNRDLLKLYLEDTEIEMITAENGKEFLDKLETVVPDAVLLDISLPDMRGEDIVKILKQNEQFKHIPIIALTAYGTKEDIEKYRIFFDNYLIKPVSRQDVVMVLAKYLPHKKNVAKLDSKMSGENFINLISKQKSRFNVDLQQSLIQIIDPLYKSIKQVLSVSELKLFSKEMKILAEKYEIEGLILYAKKFEDSITSFDLNQINKLLSQYPEIKKNITEN